MNRIPEDPIILLSWTNTQLRDNYTSLEALCDDLNLSQDEIIKKLGDLGYSYDKVLNKFW